jgi:hypothetical protein
VPFSPCLFSSVLSQCLFYLFSFGTYFVAICGSRPIFIAAEFIRQLKGYYGKIAFPINLKLFLVLNVSDPSFCHFSIVRPVFACIRPESLNLR